MGKGNKKVVSTEPQNCPFYDKCALRLQPLSSTDVPNIAAYPWARFIYTLVAWCLLGLGINEGFFTAMFFFALPILMDCCRFTPTTATRKKIWKGELSVLIFWCVVAFLGIVKIFLLEESSGVWGVITSEKFIGFQIPFIPLKDIWRALLSVVSVTLIDIFFNESRVIQASRQ